MRQRIGEALGRAAREEPALGEQVMALSRASISTLHRFCGSLLREHFQALAIDQPESASPISVPESSSRSARR